MWNPFSRSSRTDSVPTESNAAQSACGRDDATPTSTADRAMVASQAGIDTPTAVAVETLANIDRIGPITIVTLLANELTQHRNGPELADLLDELVAQGNRHLVFDIQNVSFMDSRCVGCLVQAMNELVRQGGKEAGIALANPRSSVAHLFRITRLDRVFPICNDVFAAVNILERRMA